MTKLRPPATTALSLILAAHEFRLGMPVLGKLAAKRGEAPGSNKYPRPHQGTKQVLKALLRGEKEATREK